MPQKALMKGKKVEKKVAANKHGKTGVTKKGKLEKTPKHTKALQLYMENKEITKMINNKNESNLASKAETAGGRLKALKAGPPVLAPKSTKGNSKKAAAQQEDDLEMDES